MDEQRLCKAFAEGLPAGCRWGLRFFEQHQQSVAVRGGVCLPPSGAQDLGAMVTIQDGGGEGYAATADLTPSGLLAAAKAARGWARQAGHLIKADPQTLPQGRGSYAGPCESDPFAEDLGTLIERCRLVDQALNDDPRVVECFAAISWWRSRSVIFSSEGAQWEQKHHALVPYASVTVHEHGQTQERTLGSHQAGQGGLEILQRVNFDTAAPQLLDESLQLLAAPECPEGSRDVILLPSQMVLQIHESIGHPLELDRILGDERNYAGTSFVTPEMFGSYRYGSDLLNVTFDPTVQGQLASYASDDSGTPAERVHLIKNGILQRPLGGTLSQLRAGMPGTANSRSSSWNRAPIDRMANLNLEPGTGSLEDLIAATEHGILMDTNRSWSIDDSRNKFQFGCEYARLISDGELGPVVRNPGYRAISATFWRNLVGVAGPESWRVNGTPNCGKGEPNQVICTGHAAPPCRFAQVEVFGGA